MLSRFGQTWATVADSTLAHANKNSKSSGQFAKLLVNMAMIELVMLLDIDTATED